MEFSKFVIGYRNRIRKDYERSRFVAYFTIKPYLATKDKNKDINEIIPFEWEKIKKLQMKKLSRDEVNELQTKFNFF